MTKAERIITIFAGIRGLLVCVKAVLTLLGRGGSLEQTHEPFQFLYRFGEQVSTAFMKSQVRMIIKGGFALIDNNQFCS